MNTHAATPNEAFNSAYIFSQKLWHRAIRFSQMVLMVPTMILGWLLPKALWIATLGAIAMIVSRAFETRNYLADLHKFSLFHVKFTLAVALTLVFYTFMHWVQAYLTAPRAGQKCPLIRANIIGQYFRAVTIHLVVYGALATYIQTETYPKWGGLAAIATMLAVSWFLGYYEFAWGYRKYTRKDEAADSGKQEGAKAAVAVENQSSTEADDYRTPVSATYPKINFSAIYGMRSVKEKLLEPAQLIVAERKVRPGAENPANGILLHGGPGNGKTAFAEALAGELEIPFVQMTYGDVSSKWVGEMPRLISNVFAYAKRCAPCVLFVDEFDSFVRSRDMGGSNEESLKITNTLLTEIVNLREHRVVLVAATNYLANLDAAAIREGRFDYKVEITPPDEEARIGLLKTAARKHLAHLGVDAQALDSVAKRWNGFSVSRLLAVAKAMPRYAKDKGLTEIGFDEWMAALREVQGRNGRVPANTKSISELVLDAATREALTMIAGRLTDAHRIESLGGTLPSGVLFYGPPGTGKTAAARALAKQAGWAFLAVSGPDLVADREKLTKLYAEAQDIRPTLVFIDEADDILRNRQYSATPDLVNRLLVLMDGTDEKVKDVVFIAATNNPEQIDPALLRAGRFTEKVEFAAPPAEQIPRFVSNWLKDKKIILSADLDAWEVASLLEGQTIANIEGVLQYALNRVIATAAKGAQLMIGREDLKAAIKVVVPEGEVT